MTADAEFDALYAAYEDTVLRTARRLVGDTDAPDVAQLVWMKVHRSFTAFRGESKPSTWLYVVTRNAARDHYRARSRRLNTVPIDALITDTSDLRFKDALVSSDAGPDALLLDQERRRDVHRRIGRLSTPHQAVLFAWCEGWTVQQTARALGIPPATVKSRTHRARTALGCPIGVM